MIIELSSSDVPPSSRLRTLFRKYATCSMCQLMILLVLLALASGSSRVVRDRVEAAIDAGQERIILPALRVAEHERRDARGVGPERQDQDIQHQADMLRVRLGNAGRGTIQRELALIDPALLRTHATLPAAAPRERTDSKYSSSRTRSDCAALAAAATLPAPSPGRARWSRRAAAKRASDGSFGLTLETTGARLLAEQAVERQLRDDLLGHRRVRIAPGNEGALHARRSRRPMLSMPVRGASMPSSKVGSGVLRADPLRRQLIHRSPAGIQIVRRWCARRSRRKARPALSASARCGRPCSCSRDSPAAGSRS